jgi:L-amino acid N-acyltransferase YncA
MVSTNVVLSKMDHNHWPAVKEIYEAGIASGMATFETEIPQWSEWDSTHLKSCRIVALCDDQVAGWAALRPFSQRSVYRGVAEVTIYVALRYQGQGIGKQLLKKLIKESESAGIWTLQAGIFPGNKSSINLHKSMGFREVGYREKIGQLNGHWRDVILLERRSQCVNLL